MLLADSHATFRARLESERRWALDDVELDVEATRGPDALAAAALPALRRIACSTGAVVAAATRAALPADALIARCRCRCIIAY